MSTPRKAKLLATKQVRRESPELDGEDLDQAVQDLLLRWDDEAVYEREAFGETGDTPFNGTCSQSGIGEGVYHGRIQ